MKLYLDLETRSAAKLNQRGVMAYVNDPAFEVLICSWAVDNAPVRAWNVLAEPDNMPERLRSVLSDPEVRLVIHNSSFDLRCMSMSPSFQRFNLSTSRVDDTMVQALAHGLPGDLATLSELFKLGGLSKMKEGKALIQQFCVPIYGQHVEFYDHTTNPKDWSMFVEYAKRDIEAMRAIHKLMPTVNYPGMEHKLWELDQVINSRGLPVDLELAEAADEAAQCERLALNDATHRATHGEVGAATQRDALLMHMATEHDVWLPDLKADTLERYLERPDLPDAVRGLIELRQQASLNTAAKYRRVIQRAMNGRLYDTMQMFGASRTGRDAGRVFQPQNLRRPNRWKGLEGQELDRAIENDVGAIKAGVAHLLDSNVMDLLGNCIRGVIRASKGKKLVVADLSNIEGRGLVWLAGERWKLDYFYKYDEGLIEFDNYVMAYARAMDVEPSKVDKYMRAIGKVMELGLGYSGGVAAFLTFAAVYHLDISELADAVWRTANPVIIGQASDKFEWAKENGYTAGLDQRQYAACEYLKQQWRSAHPMTERFWGDLEGAFRTCIDNDLQTVRVGLLKFRRQKNWLYIQLPSGRVLTYLQPKVIDGDCTFVGRDSFTKRIERIKTYSGKLAENVTSGTARDVLMHRLPDVEEAGYRVVLRVHDELVCEVPDSPEFTPERLAEIMSRPFPWSDGLPLAADGFEAYRYRKQ